MFSSQTNRKIFTLLYIYTSILRKNIEKIKNLELFLNLLLEIYLNMIKS